MITSKQEGGSDNDMFHTVTMGDYEFIAYTLREGKLKTPATETKEKVNTLLH